MKKKTLTTINKELEKLVLDNEEFSFVEDTRYKLGKLISNYDKKLAQDIVFELKEKLSNYLRENNEEELRQLYNLAVQEYNIKREQAFKLKTDEARKELAKAIREKNDIEKVLKKIERLKKIIKDLEDIVNQLYSTLDYQPKSISYNLSGRKNPNPNLFKENNKQSEKTTFEENNKLVISLNDILSLDNEEEIKSILEKKYSYLSDKDKLLACKFLLKKGFDKEFVKKFFNKIKLANIKGIKYIDLWGEIDELINQNNQIEINNLKNIITLKEFKIYFYKLLKEKQVAKLYKLDVNDFVKFYNDIYHKDIVLNNGKTFKAKYENKVQLALKEYFSNKETGKQLYKLLKENNLYTNHEKYFFSKYYPDLGYILDNEKDLGISSRSIIISRLMVNDILIQDHLQKILERIKLDKELSFLQKQTLKKLVNVFKDRLVILDLVEQIQNFLNEEDNLKKNSLVLKNYSLKEKQVIDNVSNKAIFEKYMQGKIKGRNAKQEIIKMFEVLDVEQLIKLIEKDRKNFFQKKDYYFELLLDKLSKFEKEIVDVKGKAYLDNLKIEISKFYNGKNFNDKSKIEFNNIENIKILFDSMNKFLFIKVLNKNYDKLDDDLKLQICEFLMSNGYKSSFIKKYFVKIKKENLKNIQKYNLLERKILRKRIILPKKATDLRLLQENSKNLEVKDLFDKYLQGRLRGPGSKEKIIKMIENLDVKFLIKLIEKDINKLYQKKTYYFEILNKKLKELKNEIIELKGVFWFERILCSLKSQRNCFEYEDNNFSKENIKPSFGNSTILVPSKKGYTRKKYGKTFGKLKSLEGEEKIKAKIDSMINYFLPKYLKPNLSSQAKQKWLEFVLEKKDNDYFLNKLADFLSDKNILRDLFLKDMLENNIIFLKNLSLNVNLEKKEDLEKNKLQESLKILQGISSTKSLYDFYKSLSLHFNNFEQENKQLAGELYLLFLKKLNLYVKDIPGYRPRRYIKTIITRLSKLEINYVLPYRLQKFILGKDNFRDIIDVKETNQKLFGPDKEKKIILDNLRNKSISSDGVTWYSKGLKKLEKYIDEGKPLDQKFLINLIDVLKINDLLFFAKKGIFLSLDCKVSIYFRLLKEEIPIIDKKYYSLINNLYNYLKNLPEEEIIRLFKYTRKTFQEKLDNNFSKIIKVNPGLKLVL